MFIGRIGSYGINGHTLLKRSVNPVGHQKMAAARKSNFDVAAFSMSKGGGENSGIYQRSSRLKYLTPESITYAEKIEMPDLSAELLPPAERQYTEKDALLNQYGKQFHFDLRLIKGENGEYTSSVGDGGCLFSPDMVLADDLEAFRQKLVEEGLGSEIDWDGVKSDLYLNHLGFGNAQRLGMKADYLVSRYAVLEARIEADYSGDEKEKQMDILNGIYEKAKEILTDSYADTIGGFFEELGQDGISKDMKESLALAIDQRAYQYKAAVSEAGNDYAHITNTEDQWLYQDDGFMAAQLRDYMNQSQQGLQADSCDGVYSFEDLQFAGELAKSYKEQLTYWDGRTYNETDDYALGKKLGAQFREIQDALSKSSVTDNMKSVFEDSFQSFMDEFMNKMDQKIHDNRQHVKYGLRQHPIDRNAVYRAFHDTVSAG